MSARCSHSASGSTTTSCAAGKALAVRELLAVVDDVHAEVDLVGDAGEVPADVAGADDVEARRRLERIDVDVHLPSADEAVLLREVVVQLEVHEGLAARLRCASRAFEAGVVLVAAAADGADGPAVGVDQHLGAGPLRRRSARAHDGHERDRLAALERVSRRGEDFLVQMRTSILAFCLTCSMKACACCCFFCSRQVLLDPRR